MTYETQWRKEWEVLRAERALARRRWRSAADGLAARAHDPLGLGSLVHDHPIAATGIGAAVGAVLVKLFLGSARASRDGSRESHGHGTARPASVWSSVLRDAALSIAVPWLLRMVKEKFGWDLDLGAAQEPDRPHAAAAPCAAEPATGPDPRAARS